MNKKWSFLGGLGAGAALMFLLEPTARRRRAIARDKAASAARRLGRFSVKAARDLANRSSGVVAEIGARFGEDRPTGEILAQRVRSRIGRAVSDPGAIVVLVDDGRVRLRGPVLAGEVDGLMRAAGRVRGVREVANELEVHQVPGNVPALQGRRRWRGGNWSPAVRLLSGVAAATVAVLAVARKVA